MRRGVTIRAHVLVFILVPVLAVSLYLAKRCHGAGDAQPMKALAACTLAVSKATEVTESTAPTAKRSELQPSLEWPTLSLRMTWEVGDEMELFCARLCSAVRKVAPPVLKVACKENWQDGNVFFHNAYRPNRFSLRLPVRQQVHFHMENNAGCNHEALVLWTARHKDEKMCNHFVHVPYAFVVFSFTSRPNFQDVKLLFRNRASFRADLVFRNKTKFCAFANTHCAYDAYIGLHGLNVSMKGRLLVRTVFFDLLSVSYKKVDGLAGCRKNSEPVSTPGVSRWEETIHWFSPYKFAIVFENSPGRGYITEKVINAYLAKTGTEKQCLNLLTSLHSSDLLGSDGLAAVFES